MDQRLARMTRAYEAAEQRRLAAEERAKSMSALESEAQAYRELQRLVKDNPAEALKRAGIDFESAVKGLAEGKFRPYSQEQIDIDRLRSELENTKKQNDSLRSEWERQQSEMRRADKVRKLAADIEAAAEQFPALASVPWAAERLAQLAGDEDDIDEHARRLESAIVGDIRTLLSSERVTKTLTADEAVKKQLLKALGVEDKPSQPDQQANKVSTPSNPSTLTNAVASALGDRTGSRGLSREQRRANAIAAAARHALRSGT
jgi:hypothetical protein